MLRFECDYTEGCIPEILEAIARENHTQLQGYSEDVISDRVRQKIKDLCGRQDVDTGQYHHHRLRPAPLSGRTERGTGPHRLP